MQQQAETEKWAWALHSIKAMDAFTQWQVRKITVPGVR